MDKEDMDYSRYSKDDSTENEECSEEDYSEESDYQEEDDYCDDYDEYGYEGDCCDGRERYIRDVSFGLEEGSSYEPESHKNKLQPEKWLHDPLTFGTLVKNGFKIMKDLQNFEIFHVLRVAAEKQQTDTLKMMLNNGLKCEQYTTMMCRRHENKLCKKWNSLTAVLFGINDEHIEIVKLFYDACVLVTSPISKLFDDKSVLAGDRPLSIALRRGLTKTATFLIEKGAVVDDQSVKEAGSSLDMATVEMILGHVSYANLPDYYGKIIEGSFRSCNFEDLKSPRDKLLRKKMKLERRGKENTLLEFLDKIIPWLIQQGLDLNKYPEKTSGKCSMYDGESLRRSAGCSGLDFKVREAVTALLEKYGFDQKEYNRYHGIKDIYY